MSQFDGFDGIESIDWADPAPAADLPAGFALLRPIPVGQVRYTRDSEFHAHAELLIDANVWHQALGQASTVQVAWDAGRRHLLLMPAAHGLQRTACGHRMPDGSIPAYEISVPVYRGFEAPVTSLPLVWSAEAGGLLLAWPAADAQGAAPRRTRRTKGQDLAITVLGLIALAALLVFLTHLAAPPSRSAYTNTEAIRALVDPHPNAALPVPRNPMEKDDNDAR